MTDNATVFLARTRQEARAINEGNDWKIERIGDTDMTGNLVAGINVQCAGHEARLIGNDRDRVAIHACKSDDGIGCVFRLDFEEATGIEDRFDGIAHIVWRIDTVRNQRVE